MCLWTGFKHSGKMVNLMVLRNGNDNGSEECPYSEGMQTEVFRVNFVNYMYTHTHTYKAREKRNGNS